MLSLRRQVYNTESLMLSSRKQVYNIQPPTPLLRKQMYNIVIRSMPSLRRQVYNTAINAITQMASVQQRCQCIAITQNTTESQPSEGKHKTQQSTPPFRRQAYRTKSTLPSLSKCTTQIHQCCHPQGKCTRLHHKVIAVT